jgi:hypothetical protein
MVLLRREGMAKVAGGAVWGHGCVRGGIEWPPGPERVYERPLEASNDRRFSFYHDKDRTSARVRDVVLTGPWPESLGPARLTDLAGRREAEAVGREPGD